MNNPNESGQAASLRRRWFLELITVAIGALGALVLVVPAVGVGLGSLLRKPQSVWRKVGRVDEFEIGKTVAVTFENADPVPWDGPTARSAAWLRRESKQEFVAFAIYCTHLGCPVRWDAEANLFMCPCHGGVYYRSGEVAAGPPPRPLPRYVVRIQEGQVEIQTAPIPFE